MWIREHAPRWVQRNLVNVLALVFAAALVVTALNTVRIAREARARQAAICRLYSSVATVIERPADPKVLQRTVVLIERLRLPGFETPKAIRRATVEQVNDQLRRLGRPANCPPLPAK